MGLARATIAGVPVLVLAASYSGERAFEIHLEATFAATVWEACAAEVAARGGCLYGLEAMEILRIEKGHVVVGGEVDGRLTAHELSLGRMLNPTGGFIGEAGMQRPAHREPGRLQLVGLEALDGVIPEGAMLVPAHGKPAQGHVTASGYRVIEGGSIALALLADGTARHGEEVLASSPTRKAQAWARVCSPHFYDPEGARYRD
jgi:sarcosine oxidase subunit alpha